MIKNVIIKEISDLPVKVIIKLSDTEQKYYYLVPNEQKTKVKLTKSPY